MSAFIVSDSHINALVRYASRHKVGVSYGATVMRLNAFGNEQAVAQILFAENVKSVNYRYGESETTQIDYDRGAPILTAIQAIKAAQCLRYQSCEHPDFEDSLASKFIEAIIADAIPRLEGYDSAQWAIYDEVTA
jgi:hypothetical protein